MTFLRPLLKRQAAAFAFLSVVLLTSCNGDGNGDLTRKLDAELMVSSSQLHQWQSQIDQINDGFRPAGSPQEIQYIHKLADSLRGMRVSDIELQPYSFHRWTLRKAQLDITQGGQTRTARLASYIPASGNTGAAGVEGPVIYVPGLSAVALTGTVVNLLNSGDVPGGLAGLLQDIGNLGGDLGGGLTSLLGVLASMDLSNKIVLYDVPKVTIPVGALSSIALHVNDEQGTMGPTTPYSRPFLDMVVVQAINSALKSAGATAAIGILDYPAQAADGSYYPFFAPDLPSVPTVYLDRDTGAALKQQLNSSLLSPLNVHLTLDAVEEQATSYNLVAVIPGRTPQEILLSSHTDGTNSIEDNGPAAMLGIASYFMKVPVSQRLRTLRLVFTGGHFAGSPGINGYISGNKGELQAKVLVAIEIEHLGAREWLELSPGAMGLTGLNEPQVVVSPLEQVFQRESIAFADQFDRTLVLPPVLPFGEGQAYRSSANLPMIQYITGPVYLLNYGMPEVTTKFTDYELMQRQVGAFIQMVLNLAREPVEVLRPGLGG